MLLILQPISRVINLTVTIFNMIQKFTFRIQVPEHIASELLQRPLDKKNSCPVSMNQSGGMEGWAG